MIFVFLCLTYFTQHDNFWVHPCCCKWHYFILFSWLSYIYIFIYIYIYLTSFSSIHLLMGTQVASLSCYCKQCCYEHWGACIFSDYGFLWIYAQEWDCRIIWQFYFLFFKEHPECSPQWLYQFTFPPTVQEGSLFSHTLFSICFYRLFDDGLPTGVR